MEKSFEEKKKEFAEQQFQVNQSLLDSMVKRCQALKDLMILTRENPSFLEIFPKDEIREINKAEREVPDMIMAIAELKNSDEIKGLGPLENIYGIKIYNALDKKIEELSVFVKICQAKLPKTKRPGAILWIIHPLMCTEFYAQEIYFWFFIKYMAIKKNLAIRKKKTLDEETRRLEEERDRLEKKRKKMDFD